LSKISQIQALVRYGLYYLTEHADDEVREDDLTVYDVEFGLLTGTIRRTWPKDEKFEVVGQALDGRIVGVVCRITKGNKVCVITVYEDKP
jgi:hypothetical protein